LLLRLQQLLRHALGTILSAEEELPEVFAKGRGVFLEKSSKLDLDELDIGL